MVRGKAGSLARKAGHVKTKAGSRAPQRPVKVVQVAKAPSPIRPVRGVARLPVKPTTLPGKTATLSGKTRAPQIHAAEPQARLALKERLAALSSATGKIGVLKRAVQRNFFEIGAILNHIRDAKLHEAKGYGSFEAFIEREIDISKVVCLRSARIAETMLREAAIAAGFERAAAAVAALDGEPVSGETPLRPVGSPGAFLPVHKQ